MYLIRELDRNKMQNNELLSNNELLLQFKEIKEKIQDFIANSDDFKNQMVVGMRINTTDSNTDFKNLLIDVAVFYYFEGYFHFDENDFDKTPKRTLYIHQFSVTVQGEEISIDMIH